MAASKLKRNIRNKVKRLNGLLLSILPIVDVRSLVIVFFTPYPSGKNMVPAYSRFSLKIYEICVIHLLKGFIVNK